MIYRTDAERVSPGAARTARRPSSVWRWLAAAFVALPEVWIVSAVLVGSFGLAAWAWVPVLVVLAVAVFVGRGRRWAYAAVVVLGVLAVVGGTLDPGMLSVFFWLVGGMYAALGVALLLASYRRPRGSRER